MMILAFKQKNRSKLIEIMSYGCPEQCPKLDAQLPRNNLFCPGWAEGVAGSVTEYSYQLVSVLSLISIHDRYYYLKPLSMNRIYKTRLYIYRALLSQEWDV